MPLCCGYYFVGIFFPFVFYSNKHTKLLIKKKKKTYSSKEKSQQRPAFRAYFQWFSTLYSISRRISFFWTKIWIRKSKRAVKYTNQRKTRMYRWPCLWFLLRLNSILLTNSCRFYFCLPIFFFLLFSRVIGFAPKSSLSLSPNRYSKCIERNGFSLIFHVKTDRRRLKDTISI